MSLEIAVVGCDSGCDSGPPYVIDQDFVYAKRDGLTPSFCAKFSAEVQWFTESHCHIKASCDSLEGVVELAKTVNGDIKIVRGNFATGPKIFLRHKETESDVYSKAGTEVFIRLSRYHLSPEEEEILQRRRVSSMLGDSIQRIIE